MPPFFISLDFPQPIINPFPNSLIYNICIFSPTAPLGAFFLKFSERTMEDIIESERSILGATSLLEHLPSCPIPDWLLCRPTALLWGWLIPHHHPEGSLYLLSPDLCFPHLTLFSCLMYSFILVKYNLR